MSQTEEQFSADIKSNGVLVVDDKAATLTVKEDDQGQEWLQYFDDDAELQARRRAVPGQPLDRARGGPRFKDAQRAFPARTVRTRKKRPMRDLRLHVVAACAAALILSGCGKEESAPGPAKKAAVEEKVAPYTYPAPVKGHYKEINIGEFDVVDGIAYPATGGGGTVVYVTSKPIASPMIAGSACPMTQARVLAEMRDARYLEVTLANGISKYFAAGTYFSGSSREQEVGGRYWSSRMKPDPERAIGTVDAQASRRF